MLLATIEFTVRWNLSTIAMVDGRETVVRIFSISVQRSSSRKSSDSNSGALSVRIGIGAPNYDKAWIIRLVPSPRPEHYDIWEVSQKQTLKNHPPKSKYTDCTERGWGSVTSTLTSIQGSTTSGVCLMLFLGALPLIPERFTTTQKGIQICTPFWPVGSRLNSSSSVSSRQVSIRHSCVDYIQELLSTFRWNYLSPAKYILSYFQKALMKLNPGSKTPQNMDSVWLKRNWFPRRFLLNFSSSE